MFSYVFIYLKLFQSLKFRFKVKSRILYWVTSEVQSYQDESLSKFRRPQVGSFKVRSFERPNLGTTELWESDPNLERPDLKNSTMISYYEAVEFFNLKSFGVQIWCSVFWRCVLFNVDHSLLGPYSTLCLIWGSVIRLLSLSMFGHSLYGHLTFSLLTFSRWTKHLCWSIAQHFCLKWYNRFTDTFPR
jgi:hypothetical protein